MKRINIRRGVILLFVLAAFAAGLTVEMSSRRNPAPRAQAEEPTELKETAGDLRTAVVNELSTAAVRLPIAALLGAVLALRWRRGTQGGNALVVQTQIVLAVVGALIMLVVGASLARAFGIVGVASLIRYRSKIADPKEAGVMLSALAVGLACGVGLYALAIFGTVFLVATLTLIESFEPQVRTFELSIKMGDKTTEFRPRIETVLGRFHATHELRASSDDLAQYQITAPDDISTDRVTEALNALWPEGNPSVEWTEKTKSKSG